MANQQGSGLSVHTERKLIAVAQSGNAVDSQRAKRHLFDAYRGLIAKLTHQVTRDLGWGPKPAKVFGDFFQEAAICFMECLEQFDLSQDEAGLSTYAYESIRGRLLNYRRSGKRRRKDVFLDDLPLVEGQVHLSPDDLLQDPVDHVDLTEKRTDRKRRSDHVQKALDRLTPKQRKVVRAIYWQRLSQAAVAERMGNTRSSVNQLLRRAYENLKAMLDGRG